MCLPLAVFHEVEAAMNVAAAPQKSARPVVLLVDDDDVVREATTRILERAGFTVVPLQSAELAVDWLERATALPDLVLSDMYMAGASGIELLSVIEHTWPALATRFVLYSGGHSGRIPPGVPFIEKPYAPEALCGTLRERLGAGT